MPPHNARTRPRQLSIIYPPNGKQQKTRPKKFNAILIVNVLYFQMVHPSPIVVPARLPFCRVSQRGHSSNKWLTIVGRVLQCCVSLCYNTAPPRGTKKRDFVEYRYTSTLFFRGLFVPDFQTISFRINSPKVWQLLSFNNLSSFSFSSKLSFACTTL